MRLFQTARHLEAVQITDRLRRRLLPFRRLPAAEKTPELRRRTAASAAVPPGDLPAGNGFRFLNRLVVPNGDSRWEPEGAERLWHYHLHYFRYLPALSASAGLGRMLDWITSNQEARGIGWEPYPLSLRIREWIEWLVAHPDVPTDHQQRILRSLGQQTAALAEQLEYHLLGNHLLENGITLAWAGLSLEEPRSAAWVTTGTEILSTELSRQVLADGSHDERSPMYQALICQALDRLARVAADSEQPGRERIRQLAEPAARALAGSVAQLVHPDGDYALLNDCALSGAPPLGELARNLAAQSCREPDTGSWTLPAAGYSGVRENGTYLVFDSGPLGPDHQPGHGHADTLSFELSRHRRRLITDTGVFTYEAGVARRHDRGTAAHNTIEVDGIDQAELWGQFRCARRPRITQSAVGRDGSERSWIGAFRGPGRARHGVAHRRELRLAGNRLLATDELVSAGKHRATVRLHLAPGVTVRAADGGWKLLDGTIPLARVASPGLAWHEARSPYHPDFGVEEERACLEAPFEWSDTATVQWELALR